MAAASSLWKRAALGIGVAAIVASIAIPAFTGLAVRRGEAGPLSHAKFIGLACKEYAIDHGGNYPPSLDALIPTYISDRRILASPFKPNEPIGYTYTTGLKDTSPADTILIEDKFAPLKHYRIGVRLDDSAQVSRTP